MRGRQARRGQEVRRLRGDPAGLRRLHQGRRRRRARSCTKACKLPADVSQVAKDTQAYFDSGKASPALEFKSPIKGPYLEQICIQVGTGQVSAPEGRRALRRGRQEAGPAARPARLGLIEQPSGRSHV